VNRSVVVRKYTDEKHAKRSVICVSVSKNGENNQLFKSTFLPQLLCFKPASIRWALLQLCWYVALYTDSHIRTPLKIFSYRSKGKHSIFITISEIHSNLVVIRKKCICFRYIFPVNGKLFPYKMFGITSMISYEAVLSIEATATENYN